MRLTVAQVHAVAAWVTDQGSDEAVALDIVIGVDHDRRYPGSVAVMVGGECAGFAPDGHLVDVL